MTKDELAELKKRWMPTDAVMETHYEGCIFDSHACAINALIAHVEAMDAALAEIAKGAEPLSEFEPDDDPWPLDGYTAEDAQRRGKEWMHAKLADIAEKARLK